MTDEEIHSLYAQAQGKLKSEIGVIPSHLLTLRPFARLIEQRAREEEREACVMLCETEQRLWAFINRTFEARGAETCVRSIRARGEA